MKNAHAMRIAAAYAAVALLIQPAALLACAQGEGTGRAMTAGEIAKLRKHRARQEAFLASVVKTLNKTCGTRIAAKIDWDTAGLEPNSVANYCSHALDSIGRLCADASGQPDMSGKAAVAKQIQTVNCSQGGERALGLKDGTFYVQSRFDAPDERSTIIEFLRNNL